MIKEYAKRLTTAPPSFFARIFGVFKVTISSSSPKFLIVMENLCERFDKPLAFDLKGSSHERKSTSIVYENFRYMPRDKIYKDLDFTASVREIKLPENIIQRIVSSLELDSQLLETYEIMDYSMLLFIEEMTPNNEILLLSNRCFQFEEFVISIGIIDYLQGYSVRKKLETKFNALKPDQTNNYSCIPPDSYRQRFLYMVNHIFNIIYSE